MFILLTVLLGASDAPQQYRPVVDRVQFDCYASKAADIPVPAGKLLYLDLVGCRPVVRRASRSLPSFPGDNYPKTSPNRTGRRNAVRHQPEPVETTLLLNRQQLACLADPAKRRQVLEPVGRDRYRLRLDRCR